MGAFSLKPKNGKMFEKTNKYLNTTKEALSKINLNEYGRMGVAALQQATPKATGETAAAWDYAVIRGKDFTKIVWTNNNTVGDNTIPVAVLLQYGHLSKEGFYIEGIDYINPAMRPIFEDIASKLWKEANKH